MNTRPKIIGLFGVTTQEIAHRTLSGILAYTREVGGLVVRDFRVPPNDDRQLSLSPPWLGRADGVVAQVGRYLGTTDKETADWLLRGGAPVVSPTSDWRDARVPCVRVEQNSLARLAAEHLLECGCQSFLFVGYTGAPAGSTLRAKALKQALARKRRRLEQIFIDSGLFGYPADADLVRGETKLGRLLTSLPKPLGVWGLNDYFARGVCRLCEHLNLAVPDQVRVLGVDDLFSARSEMPSLSSIHTPGERVGYLAMKALHQMLEGQKAPKLTEVPATELVVRESTIGGHRTSPELQETVAYIARHACSGLAVEHLAQRLCISRRSFELKFQEFVGHSPGVEIQRIRLERAKELLWQTELSIKQISALVGYQETACFSKFFRKETGLAPREYRATASA